MLRYGFTDLFGAFCDDDHDHDHDDDYKVNRKVSSADDSHREASPTRPAAPCRDRSTFSSLTKIPPVVCL